MKNRLQLTRKNFPPACDEHIARCGRKGRVYISGAITGLQREQYIELFTVAEQELRKRGYYKIVNPIRVWACRWPWLYRIFGYRLTLLYDLWLLMHCHVIYKIPGWQSSHGANIESCVAYHLKIWPIFKEDIPHLDQQLERIRLKWAKRAENYDKRRDD